MCLHFQTPGCQYFNLSDAVIADCLYIPLKNTFSYVPVNDVFAPCSFVFVTRCTMFSVYISINFHELSSHRYFCSMQVFVELISCKILAPFHNIFCDCFDLCKLRVQRRELFKKTCAVVLIYATVFKHS